MGIQIIPTGWKSYDAYYKDTNEINTVESLLKEYDNIVSISSPETE